jgi:chemotaxis protein MotB
MTLALEAERKRAEETLTLLAAARTEAAKGAEVVDLKDAALAAAEAALSAEQDKVLAAAREVELAEPADRGAAGAAGFLATGAGRGGRKGRRGAGAAGIAGAQLNAALAQVAAEQKARADLEEAERQRLEAENADLEKFRSEFFGQFPASGGREGVRVVGDRFVFSSEVLFKPGAADLAPEGRAQIAGVVQILDEIRGEIPRGSTGSSGSTATPTTCPWPAPGLCRQLGTLSQARALSVVRFMQDELGFPPERLAATGFGEYRPVAAGDTEEARAQNRRIELKLTER